jgi:hypothetical protein
MNFNMEEGVIRRIRSESRDKHAEVEHTDWVSIRTVLMRVLQAFPEARAAVVEGLAEWAI